MLIYVMAGFSGQSSNIFTCVYICNIYRNSVASDEKYHTSSLSWYEIYTAR